MAEYSRSQIETMVRDLPRPDFRARLRRDLEREGTMTTMTTMKTGSVAPRRQAAAPALRIRNAAAAMQFYKDVFGATEIMRFEVEGHIAHAEIEIDNSLIYLGEEVADLGYPSPQTLGGTPIAMHLYVDDVDAVVARAVAAGATIFKPVADEFYGDRVGQIVDPFGFAWSVATRKEDLSVDEMYRRFATLQGEPGAPAKRAVREGFHTVTPYVVVQDAPALIDFAARVFGAEETGRFVGAGLHAEVRIGDSMLMVGGGMPDRPYSGQQWTTAFHIYVTDTDAVYKRALEAGATSIGEPTDQPYGERSAGVKDGFGNVWYIATAHGERHMPAGLQTLNVYLHPLRAEPLIAFMTRAFGATNLQKYASPDGVIQHAQLTIGDTVIEMGEARGPYQPMPTRFYLYVPDVDGSYRRALGAGATSISEPTDQPYGERVAGVADAFGNQWYLAAPVVR
jgi:PhnB protein